MRSLQQILQGTGYSENQAEVFLTNCYLDFCYFAKHVFGFAISSYHKEWAELIEKYPRLCLIAFRGSGKTNWIIAYFVWKAIFSGNLNFLIISFNFDNSKLVLKIIRGLISDNEILKQYIPEGREAIWKATELTLKTGAVFYCRTYGEGVRSLRIDYMLCDEGGKYEDKSIFWSAISPVVQLNMGKIIVIGTRTSEIDLLNDLKENDEYFCKEYPAEIDGQPLWPQKYTTLPHDTLYQRSLIKVRKEIGELPYLQEYMLIPISSANSLFPFSLTMKALANDMEFLSYGRKDERYYIGYDIAMAAKGDFVVMSVLGINATHKRLVKAIRFRGDYMVQKEKLRNLVGEFQPMKICIDATSIGEQQTKELQQEFGNIEAVKFTYEEKMKMILDLRQEFEKFNLIIPNKMGDAYSFTQILLKELNEFTLKVDLRPGNTVRPKFSSGKYDDTVISLALANKATISNFGNVSIAGLGGED